MRRTSIMQEIKDRVLSPSENRRLGVRCHILRETGIGREVIRNSNLELRLPIANALDIVMKLILTDVRARSTKFERLKEAFIDACKPHILKGGKIKGHRPRYLGRAIECTRFHEMVTTKRALSTDQFQTLIERLISSSYDNLRGDFRLLFDQMGLSDSATESVLGGYVIWATLNPLDPDGDPFASMPGNADGVRARLGLPEEEMRRRGVGRAVEAGLEKEVAAGLICIVYQIPDGIELLYPTIADAGWNVYFRSAQYGDRWGTTQPLPRVAEERGRPEVVHKPVPVGQIRFQNIRFL